MAAIRRGCSATPRSSSSCRRCCSAEAGRLEELLLRESTTIGVRRSSVTRRALPREMREVEVFGHPVQMKTVSLPGGGERAKAEYEDIRRVAAATGRSTAEVLEAIAKIT